MPALKGGDLCWGQRYHWLRYHQVPPGTRHDAHIVASCPLPDGVTMAHLRATLDYLIRRHEALRTVYDADAAPWPQQRVQPPAALPITVASTEQDGTPAPGEVVAALTVADFDLAADWPIRVCAVTTGGAPRRLVVVLNHVAFDDWSLTTFRTEFETVLAAVLARRRAVLAPVTSQPVDLARYEAGRPAESTAAVLEHWRAEIAALPADLLASRRNPAPAEAVSASFTSPELLGVVRELAHRYRCWPSTVHLAAYAVTMAAYSQQSTIAHRWLTSHREASQHLAVMTCMFSSTLVSIDLADDPPFGEVIRRVGERVAQAQAQAYLPFDEIGELFATESFRRGQEVRVASELNFLSYAPRGCGTRRDRFAWNPKPHAWAQSGSDLYLAIYEWADGVTIALHAAAAVFGAEAVESFLRGYAWLLRKHADPDRELTVSQAAAGIGFEPPPERRLVEIGRDLVELDRTESLLGCHPAVGSARVAVVAGELVAEVSALLPVSAHELRQHVLSGLPSHPVARCPDRFEITGAGAGAGSSRDCIDSERALADAVASANGLDRVELAECYTTAGGRALRAPRVVSLLARDGWTGLTVAALAGSRPLQALAAELTRS